MVRASVCKAWVGTVAPAVSVVAPAAPPTFAVGGLAESARDAFLVLDGPVRVLQPDLGP